MLLTRDEMHFDFGGKKLHPVKDRDVIAWAVQQFLYGEITGIQVGHWIYNAPDLEAARFLARQAVEEFQHVGNFLRILEILGVAPAPAASPVRFLATTLMGGDWAEHVAMEMALGEGFVLQAFYAMIETVDEPEIVAILSRGVKQEERHVEFGEQQTAKAIQGKPWLRRRLLGLALVSLWGVGRLESIMKSRLPMEHPVIAQLPALVRHTVKCAETRLLRIGVLDRPLEEISGAERAALVAEAYAGKALGGAASLAISPLRLVGLFSKKRLTETYLDDPIVKGKVKKADLSEGDGDEAPPRVSARA